MRRLILPSAFLVVLAATSLLARQAGEPIVITERMHHLGDDPCPEWTEATEAPEGTRLEFSFEASGSPGEGTLLLRQRNVDDPWHMRLNDVEIGVLKRGSELTERFYTVPDGVLRKGTNRFVLEPDVPADDITVGEIRLWERPFRQVLDLRGVTVRVRDGASGSGSPARVTFVDADGALAPVYYAETVSTAVREGVVYTGTGQLEAELAPGEYDVYATRGFEWSLGHQRLRVDGAEHVIELELVREVDTTGFVACDTHVHTLTYSGHGDSSVEERVVTLAGEGVELAIATDHNHNTDYRPVQRTLALDSYFTPVVGNEVSTPVGHFNAFPLDPAEAVPPHDLRDFEAIVAGCRERGALAVILNHPRWPDHETGPYGVCGLDHFTGEPRREPITHPYDAMELINSQTEETEPMLLFQDWFALLNRGEHVMGVGSSDSHTVGGVVGQGRTYVRSSTDEPTAIDVEECARNVAAGRSSVSMGLFVDVRSGGRSVMGELLPAGTECEVRVAAPSWIRPERLTVFVNGVAVAEHELAGASGVPFEVRFPLPATAAERTHDAWLTCVATGAPVGGPWWPQINPYTLGASNPVFLDADGDLAYASPRATAEALVARNGTEREAVETMLRASDQAVAVQLLHLVRQSYLREAHARALSVGTEAASFHPDLEGYLGSLEEPR
jgi:hypothetical protein